MSSVFDRPLTWLFWIATISLNVVIVVGAPNFWIEVLIVGQALVFAAWASIGRLHRLASAAIVVVSIPVLAGIVELESPSDDSTPEWRWVLGAIAILSLVCAATARCLRAILRLTSEVQIPPRKFHFPLIELFGWTIVVAVASVLLREAILQSLLTIAMIPWIFTAAVSALMAVLLLAPERPSRSVAVGIAGSAVGIDLVAKETLWRDAGSAAVGIYVFVAVWILMTRLDDRITEQLRDDCSRPPAEL
jgi:hypothetical protein